MIDVESYKEATDRFCESLAVLQAEPESKLDQISVFHQFEVLHNISESILRRVFSDHQGGGYATFLSLRELLRQAGDEGIFLALPTQWLEFTMLLQRVNDEWLQTANPRVPAESLPALREFACLVQSFASKLEQAASLAAQ